MIESFEKQISSNVLDKLKKFITDRIEWKERKSINDNNHYELLKYAFQSIDFKKKNAIDSLKFEFMGPTVKNNKPLTGKITAFGKKSHFSKLNFDSLFDVHTAKKYFSLIEKSPLRFIRFKIKSLKRDLKRKLLILIYSEDNLQKEDSFELLGLDQDEVNIQAEKIKILLENARSTMIDIRNFDIQKVKQLVEDFQKNESTSSEKNEEEEDEKGSNNIDIYLHETSKKIFINGFDDEEINDVKESLFRLINGSREINRTIQIKNSIYKMHVERNFRFFNNLRQNFKGLRIFNNLQRLQHIRVCGKSEEVGKAISNIEQLFNRMSDSIIFKDLEIKQSEYRYLMKQKDSIEKISSETNVIINTNSFKKYVSLKLRSIEIVLYERKP